MATEYELNELARVGRSGARTMKTRFAVVVENKLVTVKGISERFKLTRHQTTKLLQRTEHPLTWGKLKVNAEEIKNGRA